MWKVFNHNDTFLGEFTTRPAAEKEAAFYRNETGNAAYVDDEGTDGPEVAESTTQTN